MQLGLVLAAFVYYLIAPWALRRVAVPLTEWHEVEEGVGPDDAQQAEQFFRFGKGRGTRQ